MKDNAQFNIYTSEHCDEYKYQKNVICLLKPHIKFLLYLEDKQQSMPDNVVTILKECSTKTLLQLFETHFQTNNI